MSTRVTLRAVSAALQAAFPGIELVKGRGYFYFMGGGSEDWMQSGVYVYHLNALSLAQWIDEAHTLAGERDRRGM